MSAEKIAMSAAVSGARPLTVLFDTNVWMDFFTNRRGNAHDVALLIDAIASGDGSVLTTITTVKDLFYLIPCYLKREAEADGGAGNMAAAREAIAWSCVRMVRKLSTVVGTDTADLLWAEANRAVEPDLEDGLLLETVRRAGADFVVSSDRGLLRRSPVPGLTPGELLAVVLKQGR